MAGRDSSLQAKYGAKVTKSGFTKYKKTLIAYANNIYILIIIC